MIFLLQGDSGAKIVALTQETFSIQALKRIQECRGFCNQWHIKARDDFDFIAGHQWLPEDENLLRQQNRPHTTFNYSEKMIDAVAGAEVSSRQEVVYKPRGMADSPLAELWTNAARWIRDECHAEDEESDAFRDCLITGMGWTSTHMDYSEDPDGRIVINRIDPMDMYWDPASTKPGLAERRYDVQCVWMDNADIAKRWPDAVPMGVDQMDAGATGIIIHGFRYQLGVEDDQEKRLDQSAIWHYECMEMEPYYRVATDKQVQEISEDDFRSMKKQLDQFGFKYVKSWKKVYYRGFINDHQVLEWGKAPCQHGFTRQCLTGKRDRNKNTWYGLTRVMKDPQRWANKWLSQIMNIINLNAKGGLLAEQGAFVDQRRAEEEWSDPGSIVHLNEGGINKIKEKQMSSYPQGLDRLMEFALGSLPQVTGINLEALGLANRDQANVLEQSRKQAAYGLLAPIFDSLHRYRKMQGKVMLYFIRQFISDGRMVRINGTGSQQYLPLTKIPEAIEFDIIVDDAPTAPDVKTRTWEALMQIVPVMMKEGIPVPPDLLTYAPLPTDLVQKWQQFMLQHQNMPNPQQMQQMQQQMQQTMQENQQLKQKLADKSEEIQIKAWEASQKIQLQQQELNGKLLIEKQAHENDMVMSQQKMHHDQVLKTHQTQGDLKIKAMQAGMGDQTGEDGHVQMKIDTSDIATSLEKITAQFTQAMQSLAAEMGRPKTVVRDAQGNLVGVK